MTIFISTAIIQAFYLSFFGVLAVMTAIYTLFQVEEDIDPLVVFSIGIILLLAGYLYWRRSRATIAISGIGMIVYLFSGIVLCGFGVSEWSLEADFVVTLTTFLLVILAINGILIYHGWRNLHLLQWW